MARVDHLRWDAFHEGHDLPSQVEAYRAHHGVYPEVVLGDMIYGSRDNRRYVKDRGIRFAGKPLGRPRQVTEQNRAEQKRLAAQRREEYLQRIPIGVKFGQSKNGYRLNYIRAKRADTSAAWINSIFLVMNLLILLEVFYWLLKRVGTGVRRWLSKLIVTRKGRWPAWVEQLQRPRSVIATPASLLVERGITVSREAIRLWHPKHSLRSWGRHCIKFGAIYTWRLKRKHRGYGDIVYIDEVFVKINGKQHVSGGLRTRRACPTKCFGYGEVVDVYLQRNRDGAAAKRFLKRLLRSHGDEPRKTATGKLRSYGVAHRELMQDVIHST